MINSILIVDDSQVARSLIRRIITVVGFDDVEIKEAANGQEALDVLKDFECDLVFTDLNMPVMGGRELLNKLKADHETCDAYVIVVSSIGTESLSSELMAEGATAIFGKPVSMPEICQYLSEFKTGEDVLW